MKQSLLIGLVPLAMVLAWSDANPTLVFCVALASIVPLVGMMGDATERLAAKLGPSAGGLLNATLSNLPELIIGVVALRNGLHEVVKASLTGGILANLLVGLGLALIVGGMRNGEQLIDRRKLSVSSSMLIICAFCLIVPAVFRLGTSEDTRELSFEMSIVLLALYCLNLGATFLSGPTGLVSSEQMPDEHPETASWKSLSLLAVAAILLGFVSEIVSDALRPTAAALGLSDTFSGIVLLGGVGSVGEILASLHFARRGQPSLVLEATVGSSTQLVLLVAPLLVLIGQFLGEPMDLTFTMFEVVAIVLATLVTRELIEDGGGNWFEGCLLLGVYTLLAIGFFHLPQ